MITAVLVVCAECGPQEAGTGSLSPLKLLWPRPFQMQSALGVRADAPGVMESVPPGPGQTGWADMSPLLLPRVAGHPLTRAGSGQQTRGTQTQRTVWWLTTSARSASASPTASLLGCLVHRESGRATAGAGAAGGCRGEEGGDGEVGRVEMAGGGGSEHTL